VNQLITKKSIHINLLTETHSAFRVFSFKNQLSMQEIIEELVSRLVDGDQSLLRIVGKIKTRRNNPEVNKVFSTDIESIYAEFEKDD
jgi:hypothetical protein